MYSPFGAVLLMGWREVMFGGALNFSVFTSFSVYVIMVSVRSPSHNACVTICVLYHIKISNINHCLPSSATSKLERVREEQKHGMGGKKALAFLNSAAEK